MGRRGRQGPQTRAKSRLAGESIYSKAGGHRSTSWGELSGRQEVRASGRGRRNAASERSPQRGSRLRQGELQGVKHSQSGQREPYG
eukprot:1653378-Pyramimonas_sp.AAC.1